MAIPATRPNRARRATLSRLSTVPFKTSRSERNRARGGHQSGDARSAEIAPDRQCPRGVRWGLSRGWSQTRGSANSRNIRLCRWTADSAPPAGLGPARARAYRTDSRLRFKGHLGDDLSPKAAGQAFHRPPPHAVEGRQRGTTPAAAAVASTKKAHRTSADSRRSRRLSAGTVVPGVVVGERAEQTEGPACRAASPGEHSHEQEHERDRANDSGEHDREDRRGQTDCASDAMLAYRAARKRAALPTA